MLNESSDIQKNEKKSQKNTDADEANKKVKQAASEAAFEQIKAEQIKTEQPTAKKEEDFKEKYLRLLAEMENTRKRMQKEKQETVRFAIENAIGEFLPALDSFENALQFADKNSEEIKNWASGFQMILSQIKDVLHNHGIVAFHSEGNTFDPSYHEAMEVSETNEHPDGTILEEYSKGYKSASRTIRPARVRVARAIQENQESQESKTKSTEPSDETPRKKKKDK